MKTKFKERLTDIKQIDKAAVLDGSIRKNYIRAKNEISALTDEQHTSPNKYAEDTMLSAAVSASQLVTQENAVKRSIRSAHKKSLHTTPASIKHEQTATIDKSANAETRQIKSPQHTVKTSQQRIKTSQHTAKVKIKTNQTVSKTSQKAATDSSKRAKHISKAKRRMVRAAKAIFKVVVAAAKAIASGIKSLATTIAVGGWAAFIIILIICIIGLFLASPYGIFFSGEGNSGPIKLHEVVREINADYDEALEKIKADVDYDRLEISGSRSPWKDVLSVYAVKTSTDPLSPLEVATIDAAKKKIVEDVFWSMTKLHHEVKTVTTLKPTITVDESGNSVESIVETEEVILRVRIENKTAGQMADSLSFTPKQIKDLNELLDNKLDEMWTFVIYGLYSTTHEIVGVAQSQLGNIGGEPYWSWYGYTSRVEWCACFVSWCANECGYIDSGVVPKFSWCPYGAQWFMERNLWMDKSAVPVPGSIIFFDWDDPETKGPDGIADHVAIVERIEDGFVHTIEGNAGDRCQQRRYPVGYYEIYGYGVPSD
ncbi:MAG: CHAP domain-containing protein [Ruminococcaceae bacterium]|nr:CHAP domain-containing protein [Oscillospiraceae bacterium]